MPTFNNAINPKREADYTASLMPVRCARIKTVKPIPQGGMQGGASNVSSGTVFIPINQTAEGRTIRFHEALHVAHTKGKSQFKDMLDQALEDARLHCYCSKASQSQFQQARRDELTVALRELRTVARGDIPISPRTSLSVLRAFGILRSAPVSARNMRLLDKVFSRFDAQAKADFSRAIDVLAKCTGDTSTKTWKQARSIVSKYFASDFEGKEDKGQPQQIQSESTESDDTRSVNGQSAETLPQESESEEEQESDDKSDSKESSKKSDDSEDDSDSNSDSNGQSDDTDEEGSGQGTQDTDDTDSDEDSEDESEDSADESSEDETKSDDIAPALPEPTKPRAKRTQPDEYTADLAPTCDKEQFEKRSAQTPLKIFIRRLDMAINRVKIDLGRHAPTPVTNGRNILARKLAAAVTTPGTRVFSRPVNQGGFGTILIDASGSMNIPEQTLIDFLSKAPALTLAFYNAPNDRVKTGNIFIYAANGYRATLLDIRRLKELPHYGWGNVIDYHAMAWLIKQPAPHYLVCDEGWTGAWVEDCARLCSKLKASGQITVVPDLQAMAVILDKRGKK